MLGFEKIYKCGFFYNIYVFTTLITLNLILYACGSQPSTTHGDIVVENQRSREDIAIEIRKSKENVKVVIDKKKIEFCGNLYPIDIDTVICHSPIVDLHPLKNLKKLRYLDISRTQVKDLIPISEKYLLEELHIDGTPIEDLTPIARLKKIKKLSLEDTKIVDYSPLLSLGIGIELCAIANDDSYCGKERPGMPRQESIRNILLKATRIRVIEKYLSRKHLFLELELGRVTEDFFRRVKVFPFDRLLYETSDTKEIRSLEQAMVVEENKEWMINNHIYYGNPRIEVFSGGQHISTFVVNLEGKSLRLLVPTNQEVVTQVWNGDASLETPKKMKGWLEKRIEKGIKLNSDMPRSDKRY